MGFRTTRCAAANSRHQKDRIGELQETIAALRKTLVDQSRKNDAEEFWIKVRGGHLRIQLKDVIRLQAERDYVTVHVAGANYLYQEALSSPSGATQPPLSSYAFTAFI